MASPFRYFRKHSKAFMAVAAVLCMFIFVVGGALSGGGSGDGGNQSADALVAAWNGGSIDQGQLNALITRRKITDDFLKRLFAVGGGKSEYDFPATIPWHGILLNVQQEKNLEQAVLQTEVAATLAEQAGITVSDALINDYIEEIGLRNVDKEQIVEVLKSVGNGNPRTSEAIVFGTLRKLLAAYFYNLMYIDAGRVVMPQQRWDDWRKANERISLQAAVLPVDKFLADAPEPTEDNLLALYNDFKGADPKLQVSIGGRTFDSPDPGFADPQRVRLQYLRGSVAGLAEKLMDKVSEQDIAYYYEQHKEADFLKSSFPADDGAPESTAPAADEEATTGDKQDNATDATTTDDASSANDEAAKPDDEDSLGNAAAEDAPTGEAPTEGDGAEKAEESAEPEHSSSIGSSSPFRLVAFQEEPSADNSPTVEATAGEPAAAANAEQPSESTGSEEPATTEAQADPADKAADSSTERAVGSSAAADLYEPLDKVRDEIRRTLARDLAFEELDRAVGEAMAQLQSEYNSYGSAVIDAEEAKRPAPTPPAKLTDLTWLADKYGLAYEKTELLTAAELYETPVGKAAGGTAVQPVTVTQAAFLILKPYEPFAASELEGDVFLVMKTEDVPRRIPEFKEVRDAVAKAWKQREAAKLAEAKAKELAAEIEKSNVPFDQFFFADRGYEVIRETAFFSWLSYPAGSTNMRTPITLSEIPGLKGAGPEFMDAAFSLSDDETVGLLNFDHTAAYVIQLVRKQWSDDELKQLFLEEEPYWPGRSGMIAKHALSFNNAVEEEILINRAGFKFDDQWLEERQKRMQQ